MELTSTFGQAHSAPKPRSRAVFPGLAERDPDFFERSAVRRPFSGRHWYFRRSRHNRGSGRRRLRGCRWPCCWTESSARPSCCSNLVYMQLSSSVERCGDTGGLLGLWFQTVQVNRRFCRTMLDLLRPLIEAEAAQQGRQKLELIRTAQMRNKLLWALFSAATLVAFCIILASVLVGVHVQPITR